MTMKRLHECVINITVLVALYEEPDKPQAAIDFLKSSLGSPTPAEYDAVLNEKAELEEKCTAMESKIEELTKKVRSSFS